MKTVQTRPDDLVGSVDPADHVSSILVGAFWGLAMTFLGVVAKNMIIAHYGGHHSAAIALSGLLSGAAGLLMGYYLTMQKSSFAACLSAMAFSLIGGGLLGSFESFTPTRDLSPLLLDHWWEIPGDHIRSIKAYAASPTRQSMLVGFTCAVGTMWGAAIREATQPSYLSLGATTTTSHKEET